MIIPASRRPRSAVKLEPTLIPTPSAPPAPILSMAGTEVRYGGIVPALSAAEFTVRPSEWIAIEGGVASGKSVLLRLASARERPASGTVQVAGEDVARLRPSALRQLRRSIGVMAPDLPLLDSESGLLNVALSAWCSGAARDEGLERARMALGRVGLDPSRLAAGRCAALSGGERRLVALARALVRRPALLVLDDLLEDLDAEHAHAALAAVADFHSAGVTIVCSRRVDPIETSAPEQTPPASPWPQAVRQLRLQDGVLASGASS